MRYAGMKEGTSMKVNVYDFDNTIYRGESLVDFILYYMRRDPKIWPHLPRLAVIGIRDALHLFTVEQAIEAYAAFLEGYYVHLGDLTARVSDFWDRNERKIKPWYESVRREDDIIISGTTDFILDEIMHRMGIQRYIGSSIDPQTGKFRRLCFMENKVTAFCELYPGTEIADFYTDSMNDRAMMDIAEHVFLVQGDRIKQIK